MRTHKWTLLILSAVLYGAAFIGSQWLWWCAFFCFVPLYYVGTVQRLSFLDGFLWGLLVWILHIHGVLYSIIVMAQGPLWLRLIPSVFIVVYQAFFVGVWFWGTDKLISIARVTNSYVRLIIWVATSYSYFYWVLHYCLCIFNYWEGYIMMYPLLPLAEYPALLFSWPLLEKTSCSLYCYAPRGL